MLPGRLALATCSNGRVLAWWSLDERVPCRGMSYDRGRKSVASPEKGKGRHIAKTTAPGKLVSS